MFDNTVFRPLTNEEMPAWHANELCEAFSPQEVKPLPYIQTLLEEGRYELLGLFETPEPGGPSRLLGYAAIWTAPELSLLLLDYLGVSRVIRSLGLGSRILGLLREYYKNRPLVAESETPIPGDSEAENSIRRRRIGFYARNGFFPAYQIATCGMRWQALLSTNVNADELADVMRQHQALYGPSRTDVKVPLMPEEPVPDMPFWMK